MVFIKKIKNKIQININISIPLPHKYRGGGVALFRINKNEPEVLLGQRLNNPNKGKWSFSGGGAENKEKLSQTALREFKEETGIQLFSRYITKTAKYKIKRLFFEWTTLLIETKQDVYLIANRKIQNINDNWYQYHNNEFATIKWIPLSELKNYKLHRWVKDVIKLYQSGKMKRYVPKPESRRFVVPKRAKYLESKKQEVPLFDLAEMILFKTDPDGTKYFKPKYKIPSYV